MSAELKYQIALTLVPNIGDIHAKALINHFGEASSIFSARKKDLEALEGIGTIRANSIRTFNDFSKVEEE
ncbi:MAG: helix-hairpin-helix domain-containing protein, partial [Ginsengibacter sp.]